MDNLLVLNIYESGNIYMYYYLFINNLSNRKKLHVYFTSTKQFMNQELFTAFVLSRKNIHTFNLLFQVSSIASSDPISLRQVMRDLNQHLSFLSDAKDGEGNLSRILAEGLPSLCHDLTAVVQILDSSNFEGFKTSISQRILNLQFSATVVTFRR